jgi:thymidylate synthase
MKMIDIRRNTVADIRKTFVSKYKARDFCDNDTVEITGASFIADEDIIFGKVNEDYVDKELHWYMSKELNVKGLEPNIPEIWQDISGKQGEINSNYGWCIFSRENGHQFLNSLLQLKRDKHSRQAVMIYTRPSMHGDAKANGMRDFVCTNTVQLMIRNNALEYHVYMRSNDVVFGYNNDLAWHKHVYNMALHIMRKYYKLESKDIFWNAASLHIYPRHFNLLDKFL